MHESNEHDIFFGGGASGAVNRYGADELALTTIGIDVGSTTFHFMFTATHLLRDGEDNQFRVARREVLWRSPIYLTPYRGTHIDAAAISLAIDLGHKAARIPPDHVDSGAIILTGEALRAENARSLADATGTQTGNFVSVLAGHHLEAMLAAFGSGAVGIARDHGQRLLHVDIGGGTTKVAAIDPTGVRQTAAINGGGRIVAFDRTRRITRLGSGARPLARHVGIELASGTGLSPAQAEALGEAVADAIAGIINQDSKGSAESRLRLTPAIDRHWVPEAISFSGGVSEYLYGRESRAFGDIGPEIANALLARLSDHRIALPLIDPGEGIRATVIGAAQSTMQVSGNAVTQSADEILPLNNVVVMHPHLDNVHLAPADVAAAIRDELALYGVGQADPVALSISWQEAAGGQRLRDLALGIVEGLGADRRAPAVVLIDQHVAAELGPMLEELPRAGALLCLDGLHLSSLDYLDVGKRIEPSGVVPVVIKSLLFDVHRHEHHDEHFPDEDQDDREAESTLHGQE